MSLPTILFLVAGALVTVAFEYRRRRSLAPFLDRPHQAREWKRAFPDAPAADIREFLSLFIDAFCFRAKYKLSFAPSDVVLEIYRATNPDSFVVDALELEMLSRNFKEHYGVDIGQIWREDLSLGELFAFSKQVAT
jgi:propanediol dehydratase small subunit